MSLVMQSRAWLMMKGIAGRGDVGNLMCAAVSWAESGLSEGSPIETVASYKVQNLSRLGVGAKRPHIQ